MITANKIITKNSSGENVGVINDFNSRVISTAYNLATYHSGNIPHFSGSVQYGYEASGNVAYSNMAAIESSQLSQKSIPSITISDSTITAATLWSTMKSMTQALNKIRIFTANWYHRRNTTLGSTYQAATPGTGGDRYLVNSISGCAVFNTAFPAVSGGSDNLSFNNCNRTVS